MVTHSMKVVWKCVLTEHGELYAVEDTVVGHGGSIGIHLIVMLCVGKLVIWS